MIYLYFLCLLLILGFLRIPILLLKNRNSIRFLSSYQNKLLKLRDSLPNFDEEDFNWLIRKSDLAQSYINNYQFFNTRTGTISNIIKDGLNQVLLENSTSNRRQIIIFLRDSSIALELINLSCTSLLSKIGVLEESIYDLLFSLINPLKWLYYGIEGLFIIILIPLSAFKILNLKQAESLTHKKSFKIISFLFAIFLTIQSILSNTVTIITGWSVFIDILEKYFG